MYHIIPFERKNSMLKTSVIRGDSSTHGLMKHTGFGPVFTTQEDTHGGYKREQKRMDRLVE